MASCVWNMREETGFTTEMEAHYRTVLYDLDLVAYNNCVFDGDVVTFRKSIVTMALGLINAAAIDPSRSREVSYNLNLVAKNIDHPYLTKASHVFNSDNLRTVHQALVCGLYHLQAGRNTYDDKLRAALDAIVQRMQLNKVSAQGILAIDTISGRFDMYTNLLALLAFHVADLVLGTTYASVEDEVLSGLCRRLQDADTGLFAECFQTGSFGFPLEELTSSAFWTVRAQKPANNALTLCLYHALRPADVERAWEAYKLRFAEGLLALNASDMRGCVGTSYLTELGGKLEALLASLWCAREMGDQEFFERLLERFEQLVAAKPVEARVVYEGLPAEEGPTVCYFGMLAECHVGWGALLERDWKEHVNQDYNKVR